MSHAKTTYFLAEFLMAKQLDGAQIDAIADSVSQGFTYDQIWDLVDFFLRMK